MNIDISIIRRTTMPTDKSKLTDQDVRSEVRSHYGRIASEFEEQGDVGCCSPEESSCGCSPDLDETTMNFVSKLYETPEVNSLPAEVTGLSLGCGDPVTLASLQEGQTVLDLGSGGGIDCFLAAKQVGESGKVIGVDMTAEMIEKARANKVKLAADNVEFRLGEIEHLPVADGTVDIVISNCVINLSPDKPQVFREAYRALRPGGRLSVSDIVTNGPLPDAIMSNGDLWSSCVSGALDVKDYIAAIEEAGFRDVEVAPVILDEGLYDEVLGLSGTDSAEQSAVGTPRPDGQGRQFAAVNLENGKATVIDLSEEERAKLDRSRPPIFSAKVTATKPHTT
jgi:SAM-dependent methyltransferase